jgi:hypothetical protein
MKPAWNYEPHIVCLYRQCGHQGAETDLRREALVPSVADALAGFQIDPDGICTTRRNAAYRTLLRFIPPSQIRYIRIMTEEGAEVT